MVAKLTANLVTKNDANLALPPRFRQVLIESSLQQIAESLDAGILEPTMPSTSRSVQLQPHLPTLPILDRWYQRKNINMILVTCRLDLLVLVTRKLQIWFVCFATKYIQTALSTSKTTEAFGKKSSNR
ncbi:uncharacterized protein TNCV_2216581 [Trichonephila clavipes]|nr:uncharacterized protein TNCV_2216581 [Trichonephila clavipes]